MDAAPWGGRRHGPHAIAMALILAFAVWGCSSANDDRDAGAVRAEAGVLSDAAFLPTEVTRADDGPSDADAAAEMDASSACVAMASVRDQCPADWAAASADQIAFCAEEAPFFDTFLSIGSCRGSLRYTKYLFDAGPRFCLYDPATGRLTGFRAVDGKAGFEETSCGSNPADFNDQGCAGTTCAQLGGKADGTPDGSLDGRNPDGNPDVGAAKPCVAPLPATSVYCPATFDEIVARTVSCMTYETIDVGECASDHLLMFSRDFGTHGNECFYGQQSHALVAERFWNDTPVCDGSRVEIHVAEGMSADFCRAACGDGCTDRLVRLERYADCCRSWAYPITGCPGGDGGTDASDAEAERPPSVDGAICSSTCDGAGPTYSTAD